MAVHCNHTDGWDQNSFRWKKFFHLKHFSVPEIFSGKIGGERNSTTTNIFLNENAHILRKQNGFLDDLKKNNVIGYFLSYREAGLSDP